MASIPIILNILLFAGSEDGLRDMFSLVLDKEAIWLGQGLQGLVNLACGSFRRPYMPSLVVLQSYFEYSPLCCQLGGCGCSTRPLWKCHNYLRRHIHVGKHARTIGSNRFVGEASQ